MSLMEKERPPGKSRTTPPTSAVFDHEPGGVFAAHSHPATTARHRFPAPGTGPRRQLHTPRRPNRANGPSPRRLQGGESD